MLPNLDSNCSFDSFIAFVICSRNSLFPMSLSAGRLRGLVNPAAGLGRAAVSAVSGAGRVATSVGCASGTGRSSEPSPSPGCK